MIAPLAGQVSALFKAAYTEDPEAFYQAVEGIRQSTPHSEPFEVDAALTRLDRMLARLGYAMGADLAGVAGAMVGYASDPEAIMPIVATLVDRAAGAMEEADRFAVLYRGATGEDPPGPDDREQIPAVLERFVGTAPERGMTAPESEMLAQAWFSIDGWVQPVLYLSQRRDVRLSLPQRPRLLAGVRATREHSTTAHWLEGLLLVLDDEPLIVLDRGFAGTGRGYRVTVGGVGDNFQLHTLLAAALIGDESLGRLPGRRPSEAEIAAVTDGEPQPAEGIRGSWRLLDAAGEPIWNEDRPAGIPHLDGVRVVVLEPEPYPQAWNTGRAYPLMTPLVRIDEQLPPAEAASWLGRCAPPRA